MTKTEICECLDVSTNDLERLITLGDITDKADYTATEYKMIKRLLLDVPNEEMLEDAAEYEIGE